MLIANVYLLARERLSNYVFGLAGVLLFGYLFRESQLYSDMLLQWLFYAPLQIVGFGLWKYGRTLGDSSNQPGPMQVVMLTPQRWWLIGVLVLLAAAVLGTLMARSTDASFPYADALTTTMSIGASILMLKKVLENWVLWIAMDLIAIPIYYLKGLYVTSGLYVIFLALALYGLRNWYRTYRIAKNAAPAYAG